MIEMKLIAKTDEYKQALTAIIPQLWEFARNTPNLLDLFEDDMDLETLDTLDQGKQSIIIWIMLLLDILVPKWEDPFSSAI